MQQTLPSGSTEYNMAACTAVQNVAQQSLISPQNFTKTFLQLILSSVESQDTVAADAWLATLLDVIDVLPSNILQAEVFPVFAGKAHIAKPMRVRVISCKVLGRLAALLPVPVVTKDILPIIISLCQDPYGTVRASMCQELSCISQLIGQESNKYLLNTIVDLANDEDNSVKEAALDSIAQLIPFIPITSIKSIIIPLTKKLFLTSIEAEDNLVVAVAYIFGQYCIRLKDFLALTDKAWLLARYIHLSQLNTTFRKKTEDYRVRISAEEEELNQRLTQCRVHCAYNFPAIVAFTADLKPDYSDKLPVVLKILASDSYYLVRRSIACGFHELLKLQPRWTPLLIVEFIKLLKDENENVLEGLVPQIGTILTNFCCEGSISDKTDMAQALLRCEVMLHEALNWRLHSELLSQLQVIPKCFPADFVNRHFVPLLMQRCMTTRALPSKMAAIRIVLLIMSDEAQAKQKHKMRSQLLELCCSSNFYSRMTFVRTITMLLDISPKLLKELFFHNIIAMTEDKVPNIRLAVCKILPKLKAIAFDPYDRRLVAALESSVRRLTDEKDRDVLEQIKFMYDELDEIEHIKKSNSGSVGSTVMPFSPVQSLPPGQTQFLSKDKACERTVPLKPSKLAFGRGALPVSHKLSVPIKSISESPSKPSARSPRPAVRRLDDILTTDSFLIDAGISLPTDDSANKTIQVKPLQNYTLSKTVPEVFETLCSVEEQSGSNNTTNSKIQVNGLSVIKPIRRLPTPRPTHRYTSFAGALSNNFGKHDANSNATAINNNQENVDGSLVVENKNSSVLKVINKKFNERPSGVPLKVNQTKLTADLISDNSDKEFVQNVLKNKHRERFKLQTNRTTDTKKRFSLDVDTMSNRMIKTPNKYGNINKRYSLTVDVKKDTQIKNSLTYVNNNTKLMTPTSSSSTITKLQQRPQSCVLKNSETEAFNNTKRSMSVENLPPKSIRSASRLPVRAVDSKASKPK